MKGKKKATKIDTQAKAGLITAWLDDKQARDIVALDVGRLSSVADVFIIATAKNSRHAQALADWVLGKAKESGVGYLGMEGYSGASWILLDLNDVLLHIFTEETRSFYNLEGLWSEAGRIEVKAEGA